eukprot:44232-Rhodomonas_salina.2
MCQCACVYAVLTARFPTHLPSPHCSTAALCAVLASDGEGVRRGVSVIVSECNGACDGECDAMRWRVRGCWS